MLIEHEHEDDYTQQSLKGNELVNVVGVHHHLFQAEIAGILNSRVLAILDSVDLLAEVVGVTGLFLALLLVPALKCLYAPSDEDYRFYFGIVLDPLKYEVNSFLLVVVSVEHW